MPYPTANPVKADALAARGRLVRRVAWAAVAGLLVTGSALTVARNAVWRDPEVFFPTMVADAPRSARAHRELGTFYAETGRTEEAIAALRTSLGIRPNPATAYNLANALARARRDRIEARTVGGFGKKQTVEVDRGRLRQSVLDHCVEDVAGAGGQYRPLDAPLGRDGDVAAPAGERIGPLGDQRAHIAQGDRPV